MDRRALILVAAVLAAMALEPCARLWGWPHVAEWTVAGGAAGGLAVYMARRKRRGVSPP